MGGRRRRRDAGHFEGGVLIFILLEQATVGEPWPPSCQTIITLISGQSNVEFSQCFHHFSRGHRHSQHHHSLLSPTNYYYNDNLHCHSSLTTGIDFSQPGQAASQIQTASLGDGVLAHKLEWSEIYEHQSMASKQMCLINMHQ